MTWTRRMGRAKRNPSRFLCAGDQSGGLRFANPPYALVLPAADGAGLARPGLDPRVARLRVERVAVTPRQPGAGGGARLLDALLRNLRPGRGFLRNHHAFRFHRPAIGSRLDPDRGELRLRAEPLRREHGLGKIEAKELVGAIFVGQRGAAPYQEPRA